MIVAIPKETVPREFRVALVPDLVKKLTEAGLEVVIESEAGVPAGFPDAGYVDKGARVVPDAFAAGDIVLKVQPPTRDEITRLREGATLIAFLQPYTNDEGIAALAARKVTAFAMELMPRITRAQSMDALSAMSTITGYKAVLIAANHLPKLFPLMMTAAGTLTPARVFVIGAGVAGLQAIGTAKRLGAIVEAYDTRPVVKEQVESLGAKFVDLGLDTADAQGKGGYAKAQSEEFYRRQQEMMLRCVAAADVVITTALVPGKRAPILITEEMVTAMRPGSVIVDLAADQEGNCALTKPGEEVRHRGVLVVGPTNLASTVPFHASQMYARNVTTFLMHLLENAKDDQLALDLDDELTTGPLVTNDGKKIGGVAA